MRSLWLMNTLSMGIMILSDGREQAELNIDQIGSFISGVIDWCGIALYLQRRLGEAKKSMISIGKDQPPDPEIPRMQLAMGEVHFLAVYLRHINEYLGYLLPQIEGNMLAAASAYRGKYSSSELKSIRDVFEHRAQYLAGMGNNQASIKNPRSLASFGGILKKDKSSSLKIGSLGYEADISELMQTVQQVKNSYSERSK